MERWLGRYSGFTYALMRLFVGAAFACHGAQKLLGAFGAKKASTLEGQIAGAIELVGGTLIAVGLGAGTAAFLASGLMAVAYFKVHAPGGFWPILNKGELAVVYCFVFLYIASRGSGAYSVDRAIRSPRR